LQSTETQTTAIRKRSLAESQQTLKKAIRNYRGAVDEDNYRLKNAQLPSDVVFLNLENRNYEDLMELMFAVKSFIVAGIANLEQVVLGHSLEEMPAREAYERENRWSRVPMTGVHVVPGLSGDETMTNFLAAAPTCCAKGSQHSPKTHFRSHPHSSPFILPHLHHLRTHHRRSFIVHLE
jgi:hypothetical protein